MDADVKTRYAGYPAEYREPLLQIRALIFDVAGKIPAVGGLTESLKWGQPTYSTVTAKTGTPIRLDRFGEDKVALFFHCQTDLVSRYRMMFAGTLEFSGNRAIVIDPFRPLPLHELALCIELALTYHLHKRGHGNESV